MANRRAPRRQDVIRGQPLNYPAPVAARYTAKLDVLVRRMMVETQRELLKLFSHPDAKEFFAEDVSVASQARILMNALTKKFDDLFAELAKPLSETVIQQTNKASRVAVGSSIREMSESLVLNQALIFKGDPDIITAAVAENVKLITNIPQQYMTQVQGAVMRSISTGNGLADLVPFLAKRKGITLSRARLIAHDQTRKAMANLNRARMEKSGVKKFEWLHSAGGEHPRKLHLELSGKIFSFDKPPVIDEDTGERGIPGQLINCRCRMIPVIDFGDED